MSKKKPLINATVAREELRDALTLTCWGQRDLLSAWFALPCPQPHTGAKPRSRSSRVRKPAISRIIDSLPQLARVDPSAVAAIDGFIQERLEKEGAR